MATKSSSKSKGRTSITNARKGDPTANTKSRRHTENERKTQQNRGMDSGTHRGDRRDMSPTYTGNAKHAARGNTPRKDVKTRAR
jgi:hypothetical protein